MGGDAMIVKLSDHILSPLGDGTEANYQAVRAGRTALRRYEGRWGLPEPFVASLFEAEALAVQMRAAQLEGYTPFEQVLAAAIGRALAAAQTKEPQLDAASSKTVFVFSTTKGNVFLLDERQCGFPKERVLLGEAARQVTALLGNPNPPLVVSNACISGVCAQIAAMRLLEGGFYDYAVVAGADMQSPFIVSGFQSFKALSDEPCRPFDAARKGLNLGEAAACIVYARREKVQPGEWVACRGAIRNDANHISGPSREGEGSYRALQAVLSGLEAGRIAFVNAHGTATAYNDEMESIAITRAGLAEVPVNGLKGHFGHTMGAAGVLESILSMRALDDGCILGTKGFAECGVSRPLRLTSQHQQTDRRAFVKLLSGFGGCNAALLFAKGGLSCC